MSDQMTKTQVNLFGLSKTDYRGNPSTLCQGCGHNSISSQIIAACYEMNILPENVVKFSGIGCSSKSPTYFLNRSFGFNGLHGRMPSLATGALFGDYTLHGIGVSGDGDSASIGMGQFKHVVRRNLNMVYIIENNGVYGLTKGQFSATAEQGLQLKSQGTNPYMPIDIAWEALVGNATFVGRSFAGDPRQVKELIKAVVEHELDVRIACRPFDPTGGNETHAELVAGLSYVRARTESVRRCLRNDTYVAQAFETSDDAALHLSRQASLVSMLAFVGQAQNSNVHFSAILHASDGFRDLLRQRSLPEPLEANRGQTYRNHRRGEQSERGGRALAMDSVMPEAL